MKLDAFAQRTLGISAGSGTPLTTGRGRPKPTHGVTCCGLRVVLALVVALATWTLAGVQPAVAATETVTFKCLGFRQFLDVPHGVTKIAVDAQGASGGERRSGPTPGNGATLKATMTVVPGHMLGIDVGCQSGYGYARGGAGASGTRCPEAEPTAAGGPGLSTSTRKR